MDNKDEIIIYWIYFPGDIIDIDIDFNKWVIVDCIVSIFDNTNRSWVEVHWYNAW